ncbi:hypothetical protein ACH42_11540 [Endozoicomonas sp. (ex Bugula neritina AB1)]|nr:hypothetical protein ACH42_11540 [Endozoicomonas sp. (ex Bugula neritina AB1)]
MSETEQNLTEVQPNGSEEKPDEIQSNKTRSPKAKSKPAKSGRGLAVLAILIAAGSLGVSGYIGWQGQLLQQQIAEADQGQAGFKSSIEQLQSHIAHQQARLTDAVTSAQPLHAQVSELHQREERLVSRMDAATLRLKDLEGSSRDQWRLAEVEYLMRLANQRLLMGTDIASSRNLLQSADDILIGLDDYSLFPVREALAEDIAMVRTVSDFDQETTYLRLQALASLIPKLQLLDDHRLKESQSVTTETAKVTSETPDWQEKIKAILLDTWQQFVSLFRINTQREKPVEALLTTEQDMVIRQNLHLMLEQAKLTVLTREPAIYHSSIEQAKEWITKYFTLGGEVRDSMLTELDDLLTVNITTDMPSINRSLEALKTYQLRLETSTPEPVMKEVSPDHSSDNSQSASNENSASEFSREEPVTQEEPQP